jgi:hypothetical protein
MFQVVKKWPSIAILVNTFAKPLMNNNLRISEASYKIFARQNKV